MKYVKWFYELDRSSLAAAGGKGANLGEMTKAGFPIPPGFVVTSNAYFDYIKANGIDKIIREETERLDTYDSSKLAHASETIKLRVLGGEILPAIKEEIREAYRQMKNEPYVAVRSSATAEDLPEASFAGQQSTFLNVREADHVVQAVKECWASLFEQRSIYYRTENKFDHLKVGLAAVVQEMVQSEKAGVMFSVDPVSEDYNLLSIEAAFGIGELVVSGSVTPDNYIISKRDMRIARKEVFKQETMIVKLNDKNVLAKIKAELQEKQKLSDSEILELAKTGVDIENHYGKPQDMEWAFAGGRLYITQSRPITTLKKPNPVSQAQQTAMPQQVQAQARQAAATDLAQASVQMQLPPEVSPESIAQFSQAQKPSGAGGAPMQVSMDAAKILIKGLGASPGIAKGPVKLIPSPKDIGLMEKGDILVTDMTTPDFVPAMKKAAAIVTNTGGRTCHAAIVSREMGIPCIVGAKGATDTLKPGQFITVDAARGIVYEGDVQGMAASAGQPGDGGPSQASGAQSGSQAQVAFGQAPITGTKIYVNLAEVDFAEKTSKLPCDGVGLLRAEFMMADIGEHPKKIIAEGRQQEFIDKLAEKLRTFATSFYPRPVVYRANDFKTNEYKNLKGGEQYEPVEANPMMGYRGCARYISEPEVFKMELMAMKKVRDEFGLKNLWLMLPFVRRIGELRAIRDMLREVQIHRTRDFKLWIMVEVPSTVFLIDDFCKEGIDGVSIGSNDLTQLILGIDRDNSTLAEGFDERNHAVLKAIEAVVKSCNEHGVTCSLCGQAPSVYPDFAEKLVEFGITSMSVNPDAVETTKRIVASAEKKVMLKRLSKLSEGLKHGLQTHMD
ncbi:phosphoenolpyruvate synthase [Candidatus Parvarchaeota archaeon]|nr:phosphoenolpyruvate synthase [Candidatus Parvarchaeota archaeon]